MKRLILLLPLFLMCGKNPVASTWTPPRNYKGSIHDQLEQQLAARGGTDDDLAAKNKVEKRRDAKNN